MLKIYLKTLFVCSVLLNFIGIINGQIPSFGGCPEFEAVKEFDKERFLGTWYESERYFTVSELIAKCISANYERRADGKIYVNNAYTNRFNGVQRIISGSMKLIGKSNEGHFTVRYNGIPGPYETTLKVLDTDYESYAVIWSCSGNLIAHTQSVWVMTRERLPPGIIMQRAYGVMDKYKISRTFVVVTDQKNCETLPPPIETVDPTEPPVKKNKVKPTKIKVSSKSAVEEEFKSDEKVGTGSDVKVAVKSVHVNHNEEELREIPLSDVKSVKVETPIETVKTVKTPVEPAKDLKVETAVESVKTVKTPVEPVKDLKVETPVEPLKVLKIVTPVESESVVKVKEIVPVQTVKVVKDEIQKIPVQVITEK